MQAAEEGADADTSASVLGALAGAAYGLSGIPERWVDMLRGEWPLGTGKILRAGDLITLAESLGGVESLVAHPATMTHAAMTPEARAKAGISDGLLRLSVGIEACEDLVVDLQAGLLRAGRALADSRSEALRKTVDA